MQTYVTYFSYFFFFFHLKGFFYSLVLQHVQVHKKKDSHLEVGVKSDSFLIPRCCCIFYKLQGTINLQTQQIKFMCAP